MNYYCFYYYYYFVSQINLLLFIHRVAILELKSVNIGKKYWLNWLSLIFLLKIFNASL